MEKRIFWHSAPANGTAFAGRSLLPDFSAVAQIGAAKTRDIRVI
jgi:hypothetical protein